MIQPKVHAPPVRPPGAFCRYIGHALLADIPDEVTCEACLKKMAKAKPWRSGRFRRKPPPWVK